MSRRLLLGCIADDFTGATDLANNLVRAGMRVVQTIGTPPGQAPEIDAEAIVVALKSRTIAAADAVAQSLAACRWLRAGGAQQIYFKVCSTFDSTPAGNIGPVIEALLDELSADFCLVTPAFPDNGRTVFNGHLFVGEQLLSDSSMRTHPLTPMTDANLVRVLQAQLDPARGRRVGLIDYRRVAAGAATVAEHCATLRAEDRSIAIADAIGNADLLRLGEAARSMSLVCAGSGLAIGLPANWGIEPSDDAARLPVASGHRAIVSGSCSAATQLQVRRFIDSGGAARALDPLSAPQVFSASASTASSLTHSSEVRDARGVADGRFDWLDEIVDWARSVWQATPQRPVLFYSTAAPDAVSAVQRQLGVANAGQRIEQVLASVARACVEAGAAQLIIAGGETSGACVQALQIERMRIGPQIDPGVPWCLADSPLTVDGSIHLALKSGNFGGADFFTAAFAQLDR